MDLPISTNIPQSQNTQAASANPAADDSTTKTADPFGHVLARQMNGDANAGDTKASDAATLKPTVEATLKAVSDKKDGKSQPADAANAPGADMLAALLGGGAAAQAAIQPTAQTDTADIGKTAKSAAAASVDAKGKSAHLDHLKGISLGNGHGKLKLHGEAANATASKAAIKHAATGQEQNFAAALHAHEGKPQHATALENKMPLPQADAAQHVAGAASQLAQTNPLAAANNVPTKLTVDTPVSSKDWGGDFSQKVTWMASRNEQSAELHLNPPNLGPLDVVLKVHGDQATAMFTSPHAAVRDAVEQAMPKLREMMADNGITLGNTTVSDQGQRDNPASGSQGQQRTSSSGSDDIGAIAGTAISHGSRTIQVSRHNGLVDTFA